MRNNDYIKFYSSGAWKNCQKAYLKSVGGLCEKCKEEGLITPAEIVHHKIHLSPETINNPEITLSFSNLCALCRKHHGEEHRTSAPKRYRIEADGTVIPIA